jgi:dTDP-4-dehydrorhamnose reductase
MRVLILGASGMLGHTLFNVLKESSMINVFGTVRDINVKRHFPAPFRASLISGVDVENSDSLLDVFKTVRPNVVINCVGLVKQLSEAGNPLRAIPINSLLPHRLANISAATGARLIHISTDCVFSGSTGMYLEENQPDATDLYGQSKRWGELDYSHCVTLRTSIIGRELGRTTGLVEWFLSQEKKCDGYTESIFSGLPTAELSKVILDYVITNPSLRGLYHISSTPISKYDLLRLIADRFEKNIVITPCDSPVIDRSLDSSKFFRETSYRAPEWVDLVGML